jgi:hypothetical protein
MEFRNFFKKLELTQLIKLFKEENQFKKSTPKRKSGIQTIGYCNRKTYAISLKILVSG